MSGGLFRRQALLRVVRLGLPVVAERDLVSVLDASDTRSLQLFYEAGAEAGLPRAALETRGAAVALCYCAGQLADDLADGECEYFERPWRTGPGAQFILQNAFFATLLEAGLPGHVIRRAALELVRGAGAQQLEVRTARWDLALSRQVALGISGRQFAAYLGILWWGSAFESYAEPLGLDLGFAAHVVADARSEDPRFVTLSPPDRKGLVAMAREAVARVQRSEIRSLQRPVAEMERVLEAAA